MQDIKMHAGFPSICLGSISPHLLADVWMEWSRRAMHDNTMRGHREPKIEHVLPFFPDLVVIDGFHLDCPVGLVTGAH